MIKTAAFFIAKTAIALICVPLLALIIALLIVIMPFEIIMKYDDDGTPSKQPERKL